MPLRKEPRRGIAVRKGELLFCIISSGTLCMCVFSKEGCASESVHSLQPSPHAGTVPANCQRIVCDMHRMHSEPTCCEPKEYVDRWIAYHAFSKRGTQMYHECVCCWLFAAPQVLQSAGSSSSASAADASSVALHRSRPFPREASWQLALWDCIPGHNSWSSAYSVLSVLLQLQGTA